MMALRFWMSSGEALGKKEMGSTFALLNPHSSVEKEEQLAKQRHRCLDCVRNSQQRITFFGIRRSESPTSLVATQNIVLPVKQCQCTFKYYASTQFKVNSTLSRVLAHSLHGVVRLLKLFEFLRVVLLSGASLPNHLQGFHIARVSHKPLVA